MEQELHYLTMPERLLQQRPLVDPIVIDKKSAQNWRSVIQRVKKSLKKDNPKDKSNWRVGTTKTDNVTRVIRTN